MKIRLFAPCLTLCLLIAACSEPEEDQVVSPQEMEALEKAADQLDRVETEAVPAEVRDEVGAGQTAPAQANDETAP